MYLNKKSVCLITGGSGLVGRNLANGLKQKKLKKIILVNSKMFNLTKFDECYKMFKKFKPSIVYNFAAIYILNPNYDSIENKLLTQESKPREKQQNRPQKGINRGNFATNWK